MSAHTHEFESEAWPFSDPENVAAITCVHVLDGVRPILRVTHDEDDGCWQILCGHPHKTEDGRVVCLGCMVARDKRLLEVADLPLGWCADRHEPETSWIRSKNSAEGDADDV